MTEVKASDDVVMGIDIGGSHITAGLIHLSTGTIANHVIIRKHVNRHASAEEILSNWCDVIWELWGEFDLSGGKLGFAMPGPFDYQAGVSLIKGFDKYDALYGMNIREELSQRLGIDGADIRFRNDAVAFLEGEVRYGAAKGYKHAIGLTLGTGLGSAISHNGVTTDAELSVTPYKDERIEDSVSTRGLVRNYQQLTGETLANAQLIAERFYTDANAAAAFQQFSNDLTWFLQYFIQQQKPEIVVIGGNIAHSWKLFADDLMSQLAATVTTMPEIAMAALGEHAALLGGACCFE
ncbi:glucokinase [Filimonas lacunae]|uniref:Glucokinase n=1 Tax=Filimonas lacunae TaxID=477680 RepID=A0A173MJI5_9BACT|nr:ROK family protein [Filimonas lacunae]BAV07802.1 glucokinase [Filimonas lacunae]SIT04956.1 glucokinase [Filimonas lacunae]